MGLFFFDHLLDQIAFIRDFLIRTVDRISYKMFDIIYGLFNASFDRLCCIKVDQFVSYSQRLLGRRIFYTVGQVISVDPYQGWSGPWARVDEGGRLLEPRWSSAAILRHVVGVLQSFSLSRKSSSGPGSF